MNEDFSLWHEIAQFLYFEASLLDERRFREWLDLFTDDVHYWMPIRSTRSRGDEQAELTHEGEHAYFDDDKKSLTLRVKKIESPFSWSENPPSRTRHLVTNIRLHGHASEAAAVVDSCFIVYRSRLSTDENLWVGTREDVLRKVESRWKIAKRKIVLDQAVLQSKNLSVFF